MNTYGSQFAAVCEALALPADCAAWLHSAFFRAAERWRGRQITEGPGFGCGITPQNDPIEYSISLVKKGPCVLRFITQQSGSVDDCLLEAQEFLAADQGVRVKRDFTHDLFTFFQNHLKHDFQGNFVCWVGASMDFLNNRMLKLYLNPWALNITPVNLLSYLFQRTRCSLRTQRSVLYTLNNLPSSAFVSMVGINFGRQMEMKVYFIVHEASSADISLWLSKWGEQSEDDLFSLILPPTIKQGEVHGAISFLPALGKATRAKINYRAIDFFESDDEAIGRLNACDNWTAESSALTASLRKLSLKRNRARCITFVGVGSSKCDVYFV